VFIENLFMSILLESLNQPKKPSDHDIPSVNDSHFDDEMLGDEWLLKKLKFWKMVSGLLLIVLVFSWVLLFFFPKALIGIHDSHSELVDDTKQKGYKQNELKRESQAVESAVVEDVIVGNSVVENSVVESSVVESSVSEKNAAKNSAVEKLDLKEKSVYQPKKIQTSKTLTSKENKQSKQSTQTSIDTKSETQAKNEVEFEANDKVIEFESLPEAIILKMPELEISSYAVSTNVKKSFVVLNGAFYGVGEMIAPHLVLVAIKQEGIIVKYNGQLISKKYNL